MRACFLGQSVCTLGYGVAVIQTPPAEDKPIDRLIAPLDEAPLDSLPPPNRMFADLKRHPHFA